MKRRRFLVGSVTVCAAVFSGCLLGTDNERDGVILSHVELGNARGEPRVFDLLVTHDGEVIHWASYEVGADGEVINIDSPDEYGGVEVYVRVGEEWQRRDFDTDEYAGEQVIAIVTYGMVENDLLRISRRVSDRPTSTDE
jgi:hypothetical protein